MNDSTNCTVSITGYCGTRPQQCETPAGQTFVRFNLATHEMRRRGEQLQRHTQWHRILIWNDLAMEALALLEKGSLVTVSGRLKYRNWHDEDGVEQTSVEIWANNFKTVADNPARSPLRISADTVILAPIPASFSREVS